MDTKQIEKLLDHTKGIIKHQKEKEELKGEKFNVFSILKMESKENETHSAFLSELLNPNGSHLKKHTFLELFIQVLKKVVSDIDIDIKTAQVKTEHSIGTVNYIEKSGGRIDIYIWDKKGKSISIENKIYAYDQVVQIERYCNYKRGNNNVFYLTLSGNHPSNNSKGSMISGQDFHSISYKEHITEWLQLCIKEAVDA